MFTLLTSSHSAKQLVRGEPNVSYICSRYYRAPELIFGATDYTSSIGQTYRRLGVGMAVMAVVLCMCARFGDKSLISILLCSPHKFRRAMLSYAPLQMSSLRLRAVRPSACSHTAGTGQGWALKADPTPESILTLEPPS